MNATLKQSFSYYMHIAYYIMYVLCQDQLKLKPDLQIQDRSMRHIWATADLSCFVNEEQLGTFTVRSGYAAFYKWLKGQFAFPHRRSWFLALVLLFGMPWRREVEKTVTVQMQTLPAGLSVWITQLWPLKPWDKALVFFLQWRKRAPSRGRRYLLDWLICNDFLSEIEGKRRQAFIFLSPLCGSLNTTQHGSPDTVTNKGYTTSSWDPSRPGANRSTCLKLSGPAETWRGSPLQLSALLYFIHFQWEPGWNQWCSNGQWETMLKSNSTW